ncbi:MAG TPA: HNH endonuclease signature motif containing protein [Pirellulales bacterium]|jgi:5-methylcytosine-specific restriction endonuclease McrA|nr:HNH endonuclease signature motif containing protein [Pirellulales bacterium]
MSSNVPADVALRVRAAAGDRCGYCLSPQRLVMARLEIEHIVPRSKGGTSDESNLWLSCPLCNRFKSDHVQWLDGVTGQVVPLFNPRTQRWSEHFRWTADGLRIVGSTPTGRATVALLRLADDPDAILVRSYWVEAGWHPPTG